MKLEKGVVVIMVAFGVIFCANVRPVLIGLIYGSIT